MGLTAEQQRKQRFVERRLGPMLADATDGWVTTCAYGAWRDEEFVTVHNWGYEPVLQVDVSCDSRWAILKDVMRAVAARYE